MKNSLFARYQSLPVHQKYLALSQRERVLATLAVAVLIIFGGVMLLIDPVTADIERAERQIAGAKTNLVQTNQQIALMQEELRIDPNDKLRDQLEQVQKQINIVDTQFSTQVQDLVPPQQMPALLETVLQKADGLNLLEMTSIAPVDILLALEGSDPKADTEKESLYQHGVKLVLEGSFFDVQAYLAELEGLDWRFYWKSFNYNVNEYPLATVELEIYTLSTNRAFIGV